MSYAYYRDPRQGRVQISAPERKETLPRRPGIGPRTRAKGSRGPSMRKKAAPGSAGGVDPHQFYDSVVCDLCVDEQHLLNVPALKHH